jgi:PAS domain S-box-containing protein
MPEDKSLTALSVASVSRQIRVYGVVLVDLEGIVQSWNEGAAELLGYSSQEAVGQHFEFIFTAEDRALLVPKAEMDNALSKNYAYDDRWHLRKDQTRIYVNGGLCLIQNESAEPLGFIKILRDQTDKRERVEEISRLNGELREAHESLSRYAADLEKRVSERTQQLNERNAELEAFCYSIAHDLRAPLRSIQAMSQVVIEDYGAGMDDTCRDYLSRISRAGLKLDELTLGLLKYSRLSREEIDLGPVEVKAALDEVLASLQETIAARHADVKARAPFFAVQAQYAYLVQILGNFISNALKFVEEGEAPVIEIWSEAHNGRVRVFVRDHGIGIPEEYRERIFQLFERLHPDQTFEGAGIGLAIAHKAALRIHGSVGLTSSGPQGVTFWVDLEAAKET